MHNLFWRALKYINAATAHMMDNKKWPVRMVRTSSYRDLKRNSHAYIGYSDVLQLSTGASQMLVHQQSVREKKKHYLRNLLVKVSHVCEYSTARCGIKAYINTLHLQLHILRHFCGSKDLTPSKAFSVSSTCAQREGIVIAIARYSHAKRLTIFFLTKSHAL